MGAIGYSSGLVCALLVAGGLLAGLVACAVDEARASLMSPAPWVLLGAAAALVMMPGARRGISEALERIRQPSPRARWIVAVLIGVATTVVIYAVAVFQARDFFPKFHDEYQFLIQAQLLARGRLWMPPHLVGDFFETFYVFVRPVYAAQSFPGAALLFLPTVWLKLASWVMPLLVSGAVVGLTYRVVTELLDGVAGALAALLMVSLSEFRMLSLMFMANTPLVLLGLLALWAFLRWRREQRSGWALMVGLFAGWAAITRPVDAICMVAPIGIAMLWAMRTRLVPGLFTTSVALVVGAAPFLAMQIAFNVGVTGHALQTPFSFYNQYEQPGLGFGFGKYDPSRRPVSALPQKQELYDRMMAPEIRAHTPANIVPSLWSRIFKTLYHTTPHPILLLLLPAGMLSLRRAEWCAMVLPASLFVLLYGMYPLFLASYTPTAAPAVILCVLLGMRALQQTSALLVPIVVAAALAGWPMVNDAVSDRSLQTPTLALIQHEFPTKVRPPAIVLFNYAHGNIPDEEPVYNADVAWPDDAPIIRAHDLGERNQELFAYYAPRQPERMVYRFDRRTGAITLLGNVRDLAVKARL